MNELPEVDETKCTACGDCVQVCPTNCLSLTESLPWLVRPRDCLQCTLCVLVCPSNAIAMVADTG